MKLAKIGLIMLFLATLCSPVMGRAADKQQEPAPTAAALTGPQKVVWDYFAAYLAWLQYDFKKGDKTVKPVPNRRLDPSFVTQHFIAYYNKLMQENQRLTPPGEAGPLDYDPVICAQDYPDNMSQASIVLVNQTDTGALVKVELSGQPSDPPMTVKLKKLKEGWRIDAILCGKDDFDSLYQAMKKDQKTKKK